MPMPDEAGLRTALKPMSCFKPINADIAVRQIYDPKLQGYATNFEPRPRT